MISRRLREKADRLLQQEKGTIFKDPGGRINIALVYPNIYALGMSSLGYQGIYALLNAVPDVVCERAFLPDAEDMDEYGRTGSELVTLESRRPLKEFDIVAFSVSYENDYPNIIRILNLSKIPCRSTGRGDHDPLVIMGGVCAFYNPEPLAEFMDVCFVGEAEESLHRFLDDVRKSSGKTELLRNVMLRRGVYVPSFYAVSCGQDGKISGRQAIHGAPAVIQMTAAGDISLTPMKSLITTPEAEFSGMCLIEAMRGCPWSCRFCVAGHIYKPVRKKAFEAVRREIEGCLAGTKRVGLIGPSLSDYPHARDVLSIPGVDFSITSLRASRKSAGLVKLLTGHRSVSIAPEAGTERLRRVINKKITDADIFETAGEILNSSIETLRLYFMIGLPSETNDDIDGMVNLVRRVRESNSKGFITLSVSTFVPKPFTPFQWHPMEQLKVVKERLRLLKKGLSREKGVRVFHDVPKYAYQQGLFALGGRRISPLIEKAAREGNGTSGEPVLRNFMLFRKKDRDEILPWDFIDTGVSRDWLWREYEKALGV